MISRSVPCRSATSAALVASISIALAAATVQAEPPTLAPPTEEDTSPADKEQAPPTAAPAVESAQTPAAPAETSAAQPQAQAALDAAWAGVDGYDVRIVLDDGTSHTGRVSAVQETTFTLIDYKGGIVRVIPKATVNDLRVRIPGPTSASPLPLQTGSGMIAGGVLLTVIGTPVFLSGLVILGIASDASEIHLPLLFAGGAALGAGIPLIVSGSRRRQIYRRALYERSVPAPTLGFTRHGWTAGLRLRF